MSKVLIIEDDLSICMMYELRFKEAGFTVFTANKGAEGLKIAEQVTPDIVLLDIKMPIMSGDEVLAKLRSKKWGKNLPVIILTNTSRSEAPDSLDKLQVSEYIIKADHPPKQIVEITNRVLGKS